MVFLIRKLKKNRGMSYVELIVVLGIFSVMSTVILFNYNGFQSKIEIKNLASDVALKVVAAQKAALSGNWNISAAAAWKPSYGTYFNITSGTGDNKGFVNFVDLDTVPNHIYAGDISCSTTECLNKTTITRGNTISEIRIFPADTTVNDIGISFSRPNSGAFFSSGGAVLSGISYVQIRLLSPKGTMAYVKVYPSGRIQVN